jgi:hypothetical protein
MLSRAETVYLLGIIGVEAAAWASIARSALSFISFKTLLDVVT